MISSPRAARAQGQGESAIEELNLATLLPVSSARKPHFEAHLCRPFVFPTTSLTPSCSRLDRFALMTAMPFCRR